MSLIVKFLLFLYGGFDPGSGLTLAACLRHASRTGCYFVAIQNSASGERVSNIKVTYLRVEYNPPKGGLILHIILTHQCQDERLRSLCEGLLPYQFVGEVTAHQGSDG